MNKQSKKFLSLPTFLYIGIALLCISVLSGSIFTRTMARYTTQTAGGDGARVAGWVMDVKDEGEDTLYFLLEYIKYPGNSQSFNFKVNNFNDSGVCETAMTYTVEIINAEKNLPLEFAITSSNSSNVGTLPTLDASSLSRVSSTQVGSFPSAQRGTHSYTLTVTWPAGVHDASLHEKIDLIIVKVNAKQVD